MEIEEDIEDLENLMLLKSIVDQVKCRKRNRQLFKTRDQFGFYRTGLSILQNEEDGLFHKSVRMSKAHFQVLLNLVGPFLERNSLRRKPIPPENRLYITL